MARKNTIEKTALSLSILLFLLIGLAISVIVVNQKNKFVGNTSAAEVICTPGTRRCINQSTAAICSVDGTKWIKKYCSKFEICSSGRCQDR